MNLLPSKLISKFRTSVYFATWNQSKSNEFLVLFETGLTQLDNMKGEKSLFSDMTIVTPTLAGLA